LKNNLCVSATEKSQCADRMLDCNGRTSAALLLFCCCCRGGWGALITLTLPSA
jgi:hypothetical protein